MASFSRKRKNYIQKEFAGEETEEIEEIEVNRYDPNDLYPTHLDFIIPGKPKFPSRINNHKQKYIPKQTKPRALPIPFCTCKLPNSNYQNNYYSKIETRIPTYTNSCPYCIYENELTNENLSFKTDYDDLNYNIDQTQNDEYINDNQYRSMRNIRDNYKNQKYMINPLPRLNRREIPYDNERVYIMPYSKNNPSYEYTIMNQNIQRQNNNLEDDNIFLKDKRIVKIIRDNKIINLNQMDMNTDKDIENNNNNFYVVEQKTNNFIIDNEIMPNKNIKLKFESKEIEQKNKDINQNFNTNNSQKNNENLLNKNEQNLIKISNIENSKEDKEKNYNLTEEGENIDNNNENINNDVLGNNIIQNHNLEDKIKDKNEDKQNELKDSNLENKESVKLIENSNYLILEKNISNSNENKDSNHYANVEEIKDINNIKENKNENNDLKEKEQIEENKLNDMNLEGNLNEEEEEKEVKENQEQNEEDKINVKITNLEPPNNELEKNNENYNILNQNNIIEEENYEQNEIEKEKFKLKQKEYLNINDNIEEVDENKEDEYKINSKRNEEDEDTYQNNIQEKENININQNEGLNNYDNPDNEKFNNKNNNKEKKETGKSIKQKLEGEFNENLNINKEIQEKNEIENQSSNLNKKKVIHENKNFKQKVPQTGELLFNPKMGKKKNVEPLFSKYELLEGQERYQNLNSTTQPKEIIFKKAIEIFPSRFGFEMPYKSQLRQDDYTINNNNFEKNNLSKTTSGKKNKKMDINQKFSKKDQLNIIKTEKKTYHKYKSNVKSNNPFIGLSHYDKNTKERKNQISKKVQKEETEFNDIIIFEENILKKRDLTEEELNQFINILIKYMFESEEKNLDNKNAYEFKINKISNIIINMKKEEQVKVLENLKKNANDEYSNELFSQLQSRINDFKDKIVKVYKKEENLEDEDFENISNSSNKKKKEIKK